ncbi:carboxypeptidase C prc1 [Mortierella sp. GBA43]|nr:carboxypeptidase C prc1 [Mortierella sp. GBA43]
MIAENIRESPEPFLKTTMPSMSMARIMQLEGTYRTLEKEWIERLRRFQTTVGLLRMRWIQCAYLPVDSYDHALCKLFELAQLHDSTAEFSYLQIEDPLCLSKECLASLSAKLAQLDQNYYTRQTRIKAMEHALGGLYHDFRIPDEKRVVFRNEGTVRYAAELGRELKTLQPEMEARKLYLGGERWSALTKVWDMCLVHEQERESFRSSVEQSDTTYIEKLDRIQSEIENCRVRYSKSGAVYKLMMTRRNHIEEMISIEQRASNPKRLFQPSFQLVEEEKLRKRAFVTLLKLEGSLIEALEKFESEHETEFVYDGVRYLETLQAEIDERYVNETAFAKFTPVIAAPTSSQTARIMGTQVSPSRGARSTTSNPKVSVTPPSTGRSPESSRRSNTVSAQASSTRPSPSNRAPLSRKPQAEPPKSPQRNVQQRDTCRGSLAPLGSTRSPRSLSPAASLKLRIASRSQSRDSKDSSATGSPTGPSSPSTIAPHGHKQ